MNLRKHVNGQWGIWWSREERPPNGGWESLRRYAKSIVYDRATAEKWFKAVKKIHLEEQIGHLTNGPRVSMTELAEEYVRSKPDLSDGTLQNYLDCAKYFQGFIGSKSVIAIRTEDLEAWKSSCLKSLSPYSVKSRMGHIRALLRFAKRRGYLKEIPEIPTVRTGKALPKTIPTEHLDAILTYLKENQYEGWRYAQFCLWTGCRRSEALNLMWSNVTIHDEPNGSVMGSIVVKGKGDKERYVPLLAPALEAMGKKKSVGKVFAQHTPWTISKWFRKASTKCGYDHNFHRLRHTAATQMLERGYSLPVIQAVLGHASITTTQIYAKVRDKLVESEMARLG